MMKDRSIIPVLESWLRRQSSLGNDCHIRQTTAPKTGFSADTILLELEGCASGENGRRNLAVRVEHPASDTFLRARIAKPARMLPGRSEERLAGTVCVRPGRYRCPREHYKKNTN